MTKGCCHAHHRAIAVTVQATVASYCARRVRVGHWFLTKNTSQTNVFTRSGRQMLPAQLVADTRQQGVVTYFTEIVNINFMRKPFATHTFN